MRRSRVLALSFASKHLPFEHNYKTEGRRRKEESKMEHCELHMELGKPDAGKPPVRFDEGRKQTVIGPRASQSVASRLLYPALHKRSTRDGFQTPLLPFHSVCQTLEAAESEPF